MVHAFVLLQLSAFEKTILILSYLIIELVYFKNIYYIEFYIST